MKKKKFKKAYNTAVAATQPDGGAVNTKPILDKAYANIPPNLRPILDKIVLSGMRIMFDQSSHKMMLAELDKPGPLATRISNGVIALMYMLWTQSNKTIPPQLMVPGTLILTVKAFDFLQMSKDPEATKEVLGQAIEQAVHGVMERFGATPQAIAAAKNGGPAPAAPAPQPQGGGMLDAAQGAA